MQYFISTIVLILLSFQTFSQNPIEFDKVLIEKLDFNTPLSEISSSYSNGELLYFQNSKGLSRYKVYYDLYKIDTSSLRNKRGNKNKVSLTDQLTIVTNYHEGPSYVDNINGKIYITISYLDRSEMKAEKKLKKLDQNRLRLLEGDYSYGQITNLKEFQYNSKKHNVAHATYSNETNRLYFVSTMEGSIGKSDIFYCTKKTDGSWAKPVSVGMKVNSIGNDFFPTVKDGILFFSSDGQIGQKGDDLDIFYIKESEMEEMDPIPLTKLNSDDHDFAICFKDEKGKFEGYLTSNRGNRIAADDDIYRFSIKIPEPEIDTNYDFYTNFTYNNEIIPAGDVTLKDKEGNDLFVESLNDSNQAVFMNLIKGRQYLVLFKNDSLSGSFKVPANMEQEVVRVTFAIPDKVVTPVSDTTYDFIASFSYKNELLTEGTAILKDSKGSELFVKGIDNTGNAEFPNLIKWKSYTIDFKNNDHSESFVIPVNAKEEVVRKTFILKEKMDVISNLSNDGEDKDKNLPQTINYDRKESFENIYFAFDSYRIYQYSRIKLNRLIAYVNSNNVKYIILDAHTDSRGSNEYNDKLSISRAISCKKYLVENGIPESIIKYKAFGESKLANKCGNGIYCPDRLQIKNRRIEFTLAY